METIQIIDKTKSSHRIKVGENTLSFISKQNKLDDEGKAIVMDEAIHILNQCVKPGEKDCITNIAVGYVQSGKTLSFTTLTALAADNGYRIVIYLTGTKTNLQEQTSRRLRKDLEVDENDTYRLYTDIVDSVNIANNVRNFLMYSNEVLLFPILKHYVHINKLADIFMSLQPILAKSGVIIIDDEADQSSFNTYAKKNAKKEGDWIEDDFSKTYSSILELKRSLPNHSYVQYTATPQAAFLIDNNDILSPKYHTVLTPGKGYTGGKTFFKERKDKLVVKIPDDQVYHYKYNPLNTIPSTLTEALKEFLISLVILVFIEKKLKFLSMMVHVDGICESNEKFANWISQQIQSWFDLLNTPDGDPSKEITKNSFHKAYQSITEDIKDKPTFDDIIRVIPKAIIHTQVHLIQGNGSHDVKWNAEKGHILVGAEMLNRGFTIENLSMTYMPRTTKSKATADTIEQRCRFFGYKSSYIDFCRVYLPQKSIKEYNDYVDHEETLRTCLKQCNTLAEFSTHPSSMLLANSLNPTRTNILSSNLVRTKLDGWKQMRSLDYIKENLKESIDFIHSINEENFVPFQTFGDNIIRNHRYYKCNIDKFIQYFKSMKYLDVPNITRKIVTLQYLSYLKETIKLNYVYVVEIAYQAKSLETLRFRGLEDNERRPKNLMAGRDKENIYPGDEAFKFEDSICIQFHHLRINQPLSKYHNSELYNLSFYYPHKLAGSFIGIEEDDDED